MIGKSRRGERAGMGELEALVMGVLWDADDRLTPAEVNERVDRDLAYTTVMTILVRLFDKGTLTRERRGRAWAYAPVLGREEHAAHRMGELLHASGDESLSLARFVDEMTPKERAELQRLLASRKRKS